MNDCMEFKLKSPMTQEDFDLITDAEFEHTDKIWFNTPKGNTVEFRKVIKAEWKMRWNKFFHEEIPYCTNCNKAFVFESDYCPNCGAEMQP